MMDMNFGRCSTCYVQGMDESGGCPYLLAPFAPNECTAWCKDKKMYDEREKGCSDYVKTVRKIAEMKR